MGKQLKLFKMGFIINPHKLPTISKTVYILAYSENQARKYLRDWIVEKNKSTYLYEGAEQIKEGSADWHKAFKDGRSIEDHYNGQMKTIYRKD